MKYYAISYINHFLNVRDIVKFVNL